MTYLSLSNQSSEKKKACESNGLKASITIYLSLMLVIILALVCTLIESGRVSAMSARLRSITYMAADSAFAEYAQPMFDRFGIMGLWNDEQEYSERFNMYIKNNLDMAGTGVKTDMDLYGMKFAGSRITDVTWMTDHNGKPFADQVYEYMKTHIAEGIAEELAERTGFLEQTGKVQEVMETVSEYQGEFIKAEQTIAEINDKAQHVKDLAENPKTLLEEMSDAINGYEEGNESQAAVFAEKKQALEQSRNEMSQELIQLKETTDRYYTEAGQARSSVGSLSEQIDIREEDFDPEIYSAITERIREAEASAVEEGSSYQQITDGAAAAAEYQAKLNEMDQFFAGTQDLLGPENLEDYRAMTSRQKAELESIDMNRIGGNAVPVPSVEASTGFLITVNDKFHNGLLDYLAGSVSGKEIDQTDFPSRTVKKQKQEKDSEEESILDKSAQKALFCEYVAEHFGCFADPREGSPLDYETEYILVGKAADRDNLSSVVTQLVLMRSGICLVSLMLDGNKMAEVHELAMAVVGWTGQLYVIKIAESLIMLGWALAEAMLEVKTLFAGRHIPLLKKQEDWYLSISGLQNFSGDEAIGEDKEGGLSYEDHLRLLLMMENRRDQIFRTMDMIQADMCVTENGAFRIKDCITEASAETAFSAPAVFAGFPAVRRSFRIQSDGYPFRFIQEYHY